MLTRAFALQEASVKPDGKQETAAEKTEVLKEKEIKDKLEVKKKSAADGAYPDAEVTQFPHIAFSVMAFQEALLSFT